LNLESYPAARNCDPDLARSLIGQLVAFARNEGYRTFSVQSYCTEMPIPDLDRLGFEMAPRIEFIVDLTQSLDSIWKGISDHHRRKIQKAEKHGLVLKESCTMEDLKQLILLLGSTSDRRNSRGDRMALLENAFYEETGKKLFSRNLGKLYLLMHGSEPVSAAFVTLYAGRGFYLWGGSSGKGYGMNAAALLFWKIFYRCRELGCREFNLGGVSASAEKQDSPSHGLFRFKSAFGGRKAYCVSGTIENLQVFRGLLLAMAEKGRKAWQSW
jgi:lipid II:glycine glycyltransferase (peptidoglycan interpeptide bridge formation enzyme)